MSYVMQNGWLDDATGTVKNVVTNLPTHVNQALSTGKQMIQTYQPALDQAKKTLADARKAAAGAAAGTQRLNDGLDQWNKAKPFVYVGGAVLLFLVVRKLV